MNKIAEYEIDYEVEFTFQKTIKVKADKEKIAIQKAKDELIDFLKLPETNILREMKITSVTRNEKRRDIKNK